MSDIQDFDDIAAVTATTETSVALASALFEPYEDHPEVGRCLACGEDGVHPMFAMVTAVEVLAALAADGWSVVRTDDVNRLRSENALWVPMLSDAGEREAFLNGRRVDG